MKHIIIIFVVLILSTAQSFPKDSILVKHRQDSLRVVLEKKFWESGKKKTNTLFFSVASGYAKVISDNKYKGLWIHEASGGVVLANHWILGFRFVFWRSIYDGYVSPGVYVNSDFNGKGLNVIGGYKGNFEKNRFSINGGLGLGSYNIDDGDYMSLVTLLGLSYYPVNFLSIDSKGSFNFIFGLKEGGRAINMFSIKLGVTLYSFY